MPLLTSLGIPAALAVVGLIWWAVFSAVFFIGAFLTRRQS